VEYVVKELLAQVHYSYFKDFINVHGRLEVHFLTVNLASQHH